MRRHRAARLTSALVVLGLLLGACGGGAGKSAAPTASCLPTDPGTSVSPSPTCIVGTATPQPSAGASAPEGIVEEWVGSAEVSSTVLYPGPNRDTCEDGWTLSFAFSVDGGGNLQGSGTSTLSSPPVCPFMVGTDPATLSWRSTRFNVLGTRSATGVDLRLALVGFEPPTGATMAGFAAMFGAPAVPEGGPPVSIPIVNRAGEAEGSWQFESGNPTAVYSASGTFAIECTACD